MNKLLISLTIIVLFLTSCAPYEPRVVSEEEKQHIAEEQKSKFDEIAILVNKGYGIDENTSFSKFKNATFCWSQINAKNQRDFICKEISNSTCMQSFNSVVVSTPQHPILQSDNWYFQWLKFTLGFCDGVVASKSLLENKIKNNEDKYILFSKPKKKLEKSEKKKPNKDKIIKTASGSGFYISAKGDILTNNHIIDDCTKVTSYYNNKEVELNIIAKDKINDLALLKGTNIINENFVKFRMERGAEHGEEILVVGYPLGVFLSSQAKVTFGIISSTLGFFNNVNEFQFDAAIQPGNSGGPIYDLSGQVIGVTVAAIDKQRLYEDTGLQTENINFGIKSSVVKIFLETNKIDFQTSENTTKLETQKITEEAIKSIVYIKCWK